MLRWAKAGAILIIAATSLSAAPILFSDFQFSSNLNMLDTGTFGGWEIAERIGGDSPRDYPSNPLQAYLRVGNLSTLQSGDTPQSIDATASVSYSAPGYYVSWIMLWGIATGAGDASEVLSITAPCNAEVVGNYAPSQKVCIPTSSGTITANLHMQTGIGGTSNAGPLLLTLQLTPLSHNPEPVMFVLVGFCLTGLGYWRAKIRTPLRVSAQREPDTAPTLTSPGK